MPHYSHYKVYSLRIWLQVFGAKTNLRCQDCIIYCLFKNCQIWKKYFTISSVKGWRDQLIWFLSFARWCDPFQSIGTGFSVLSPSLDTVHTAEKCWKRKNPIKHLWCLLSDVLETWRSSLSSQADVVRVMYGNSFILSVCMLKIHVSKKTQTNKKTKKNPTIEMS